VFGDESGDLGFTRSKGASRFFILTTVTMDDCAALTEDLRALRHQLAWEEIDHPGPFHAQGDPSPLRRRVFEVLERRDFRVDSLILEKPKAQPHMRATPEKFYKYAWFYLMKFLAPQIASRDDEFLVVAASVGTKKKREAFYEGVRSVMWQVAPTSTCRTACWDARSDGCLQAADYCSWALQRKWENGDVNAYARIEDKICSEFELFSRGGRYFY
jgi:hypothetical protein